MNGGTAKGLEFEFVDINDDADDGDFIVTSADEEGDAFGGDVVVKRSRVDC